MPKNLTINTRLIFVMGFLSLQLVADRSPAGARSPT